MCENLNSSGNFDDLGFAKVDIDRKRRQGVAEVIYGAGKTAEQVVAIAKSLVSAGQVPVLVTRVEAPKADEVRELLMKSGLVLGESPSVNSASSVSKSQHASTQVNFTYHETARICVLGDMPEPDGAGTIVVVAAGTSDLTVAEEASIVAHALGNKVERIYDVGVAGIHRLMAFEDRLAVAHVIIAVAGMEGALASVVGGMASCPVIAVPTSVGYDASFGGVAALLSMLNSCSSNVSVVNIDNGFGAAYQASLINHLK